MAPSKSPAFAVCGGVSVETVVAGVGRRRSSKATRRNAVTGLAESLYADLLWDCGGANVENATEAVGTAFSTQPTSDEDFADVFGGPPKFASFRRGVTRVSDACSNEALLIQSSLSIPLKSSGFYTSIGQPRSCISQENVTGSPSSVQSVKLRSRTETQFSSRICYSDSDNKCSLPQKDDIASNEEAVPSGDSSCMRTASTIMKRREFSRSDAGEDTKDTRLSTPSRKDFAGMKENIEGFTTKVPKSEHGGHLANVHESVARSLKGSHEAKQKSGHCLQHAKAKAHRQSHSSKLKRKDHHADLWVTIQDIQCATEPSRFPPPSRPPPELHSEAAYAVRNAYEAASSTDEWQNSSSRAQPIYSIFDSGSMSSSCTQGSNTKATSQSRVIEDAVEIAEAKIRMVLEAREKAKSMVEKKLREKRRAQQLKERSAEEGKPRAECDFKGHMKDCKGEKRKSRVRYCKDEVNKHEAERTRQRDIARQCIEKVTRELHSKSAEDAQERAAELRLSHGFSEQPVEVAEVDVKGTPVHIEATSRPVHFWSETNGKQSTCEDGCEKFAEEALRKQQQDSLSSSWCSTEQKEFSAFSSLDELDSMSTSKHKTVVLFHGGESMGFQEIMGETLERRMVRWDRYCRTAARMAKALEEKKQRDLELQKEQAERHRAAEMLDEEIEVWAAGKEGNLEALLCSLHLVLWPECGWKGVSPADLATIAAVKKTYRQATLCVHPDKVQQRGATVAQKYIAEKVFDLLREASAKHV